MKTLLMLMNMWLTPFFMYIFGKMIFVFKQKPFLIVFLGLGDIVLSIFFFFLIAMVILENEMYMLMVFLVFSVCEGVLGLSILVSMIRTHGNDYFQSFNLL
uniref:NADH-ubiquinone oxidoreductase chain 4L n=1 Tax=Eogystia hippophaecolus TaxID=1206364 RepID=X2CD82_EOGHI|nr:NADH dehydrogenase subunit 4L [Eogystia hippophaecolus]AGN72388.1 NADH dehydrogenase subunit 4L [Eogystia hippophaecolus]